jgi:tetratricopeptide (TPR) repeat protein
LRATLEDSQALEAQSAALRRDPRYVPALYERVALLSSLHSRRIRHLLKSGIGTLEEAQDLSLHSTTAWRTLLEDAILLKSLLPGDDARLAAVTGILEFCEDRLVNAEDHLLRALLADPFLEEARLTWVQVQLLQVKTGQDVDVQRSILDRTEESLGEAMRRDLGNYRYPLARAETRLLRSIVIRTEDPEDALKKSEADCDVALRCLPSSIEAIFLRGDVRSHLAMRAMERGASADAYLRSARTDLEGALRRDAERQNAWMRLSVLSHAEAEHALETGLPWKGPLANLSSTVAELLHRWPESAESRMREGMLRFLEGEVLRRSSRDPHDAWTRALEAFDHALVSAPAYARIRIRRGLLFLQRGQSGDRSMKERQQDLDAALADLLQASRQWPRHPEPSLKLGEVLLARGEAGAAEAELRRTVTLDPRSALSWLALGKAQRKLARDAEAEVSWRNALLLNPTLVSAIERARAQPRG